MGLGDEYCNAYELFANLAWSYYGDHYAKVAQHADPYCGSGKHPASALSVHDGGGVYKRQSYSREAGMKHIFAQIISDSAL